MKTLTLLLAGCLAASAQVAINSIAPTPTQALVTFTAPTSPACTVQVSEASGLTPLDYDTDPAIFSNANTEATHLVNSWASGSNTTRVLRIGLRKASLSIETQPHNRSHALAANTLHYLAVTCNGVTANATFTTGTPGGIVPEAPSTDSTMWGQVAFPEFVDFSKPVIEPHTGMKIYSADPSAWSNSQPVAMTSGFDSGGSGWTNFSNLNSYGTAVATTANTNTACVYLDPTLYNDQITAFGGYWPYNNFNDMGVDLYGSGTDASPTNRTVQVQLSADSCQTAWGANTVTLALPQTTNAAAGTVPSTYPAAYFAGWGKPLPREAWPRCGSVTASAGVVTLTKDCGGGAIFSTSSSVGAYFNADWAANTKIWISGSSGTCTNSFCTIASVQSSTSLTLVENLNTAEVAYKSAAVAVIINKTNATGSVNLSVRFELAKSLPQDIWTGGCAAVTATAGDGTVGWPCILPRVRQSTGALYFIGVSGGSGPTVRFISPFANAGLSPNCTNGNNNDCPASTSSLFGPTVPSFDPADPTVMYSIIFPNVGPQSLFRMKYTGNWSAYNQPYASTTVTPPNTNEISYTNLTPASTGNDLRTQILANTTYNESLWPSLSGANLLFAGLTGPYAIFYSNAAGQNSACFVFAFTLSTGTFYKSWRTDDGSTNISNNLLHFQGCHAIEPIDGTTTSNGPSFLIANDNLTFSSSGSLLGGPFLGTITGVLRSGVFDTSNTALPWPPALPPATNGYDYTCPGGLPAWVVANGATGNQCVEVQLSQPCSATPTAAEKAAQPCAYNSNFSSLGNLVVGDFFKDNGLGGGATGDGGDYEGFMVVQIVSQTSSSATVWLQRNANFSYCAFGKDGIQNSGQLAHSTGWTYYTVGRGACQGSLILVDAASGTSGYVINQNMSRGHFDLTEVASQTATMVGAGATNGLGQSIYPSQFQRAWPNTSNVYDWAVLGGPAFGGYQSDHDTQSYIKCKQFQAAADLKRYCFDFRHYDNNNGVELEAPGQTIGSATNLTLQGGTSGVYLMSFTGTADIKHQALNVYAGHRQLIDISSAATGNQITDSTKWTYCYAYNAGECRSGSSQGALYVSGAFDLKASCWQSQMNLNVPCAMAGPTEGMQLTQVRVSSADPIGLYQRWLGQGLMVSEGQYVYSQTIPTPDASFLLFEGFLTSGYHTALMAAKLPPFPNDSVARQTFIPVYVNGVASSTIVEFGYAEYGTDGVSKFYCTTRAENCKVAGSTINEATPFSFASESLTAANGYNVLVPALPGHILYYHVVISGVAGVTQVVAVP